MSEVSEEKSALGLEGCRLTNSEGRVYLLQRRLSNYITPSNVSYFCIDLESKVRYACKVIAKHFFGNSELQHLTEQIYVLRTCHHKNILGVHDLLLTDDYIFIFFPYMGGGHLLEKINHLDSFKEEDARRVLYQVAQALCCFHENGICHREIKPENILCSSEEENFQVALSYFGMEKYIADGLNTVRGSLCYTAPELIRHELYTPASDMWSFGVLSYVLLTGTYPFQTKRDRCLEDIMAGRYDQNRLIEQSVSKFARAFIAKLIVVEPEKRSSAAEILNDPWLNGSEKCDRSVSDSAKSLESLTISTAFFDSDDDDDYVSDGDSSDLML